MIIKGGDDLHSRYVLKGTNIRNGCAIVAIIAVTGIKQARAEFLARYYGWNEECGFPPSGDLPGLCGRILGTTPRYVYVNDPFLDCWLPPCTVETFVAESSTGLLFVDGHVCPILSGRVCNIVGHEKDLVRYVAYL